MADIRYDRFGCTRRFTRGEKVFFADGCLRGWSVRPGSIYAHPICSIVGDEITAALNDLDQFGDPNPASDAMQNLCESLRMENHRSETKVRYE